MERIVERRKSLHKVASAELQAAIAIPLHIERHHWTIC